jgi:Mobilization protein NikA
MGVEGAPGEQEQEHRAAVPLMSRRRRRREGGRAHRVTVRLDDAEFTAIAARAAASRLTVASYLAAAGNRDGRGGGGWSVEQRRVLVAELLTLQRVLRGVATNLNQIAALGNAQRRVPPEVGAAAEAAGRLMTRVEQVVVALDPKGAKR